MKYIFCITFSVFSLLFNATAFADTTPKHLQLARDFLAGLKSENNQYVNNGHIRWKGEKGLLSDYEHNEAKIDCSGFVNAILEKASSPSYDVVYKKTYWRNYPKASSYHDAISNEFGFIKRSSISEVEPGDVLAIKYPAGSQNTGHVMFVDSKPEKITKEYKPIIEGTTQWKVTIIDSTIGSHGPGDTRLTVDGKEASTGVGRGSYRMYVDTTGRIVAYSYKINGKKALPSDTHPVAIGKPLQSL